MDSISLKGFAKPLSNFLHRFHVIIFVLLVAGGLAIIVLRLNTIIVSSSQTNGYTPPSSNVPFDTQTIQELENLKTSTQATTLSLPAGRINPFVE